MYTISSPVLCFANRFIINVHILEFKSTANFTMNLFKY